MQSSPFLDEIRAQGREEGFKIGFKIGRIEGVRATILLLGRKKFGKPPTKRQQKALEALSNRTQLDALADRLLAVDSWAELLAE